MTDEADDILKQDGAVLRAFEVVTLDESVHPRQYPFNLGPIIVDKFLGVFRLFAHADPLCFFDLPRHIQFNGPSVPACNMLQIRIAEHRFHAYPLLVESGLIV